MRSAIAFSGFSTPASRTSRARPSLSGNGTSAQSRLIIRRRLRVHGISERWSTLRDLLAGPCRVTATFRRADGRTLPVRKATRAEPAQLAIIQAPFAIS
jgi:hypothetical protein